MHRTRLAGIALAAPSAVHSAVDAAGGPALIPFYVTVVAVLHFAKDFDVLASANRCMDGNLSSPAFRF